MSKKKMTPMQKTIFAQVNSAAIQPGFRGAFSVVGRILDAVKNIIGGLDDNLTPEVKDEIKTAAIAVFDMLVVLPEPFDALSDMLFKKALDQVLGA
jgi:hypothetical protein